MMSREHRQEALSQAYVRAVAAQAGLIVSQSVPLANAFSPAALRDIMQRLRVAIGLGEHGVIGDIQVFREQGPVQGSNEESATSLRCLVVENSVLVPHARDARGLLVISWMALYAGHGPAAA